MTDKVLRIREADGQTKARPIRLEFRLVTNYEEEIVRFVEMRLEHEGS